MLAFRDFCSSTPGSPLTDGIDGALISANEWIGRTGIRPINVETLTEFRGNMSIKSVTRGLRVWYEIVPSA